MDYETQLKEKIREIYERARAEAEPYVALLVKIEMMKPPRPLILTRNEQTGKFDSLLGFSIDPADLHYPGHWPA